MNLRNSYFFKGLASIFPIFITIFIVLKIIEFIGYLINSFIPINGIKELIIDIFFDGDDGFILNNTITLVIYLSLAIILYLFLFGVGIIIKHFLNEQKRNLITSILKNVPIVHSIYVTVKQITNIIFSKNLSAFKKAVLVEYPRKGVYSLGFIANDNPRGINESVGEEVISIFIATAPNPSSGFIIFVPKKDIIEFNYDVKEGLKIIFSLGAIIPNSNEEEILYED